MQIFLVWAAKIHQIVLFFFTNNHINFRMILTNLTILASFCVTNVSFFLSKP